MREENIRERVKLPHLSASFFKDEAAAVGLIAALTTPVLIGGAVMGTEVGLWAYKRQSMQSASHAAATSAITSRLNGSAMVSQAHAVTAARGFVAGQNGVTVQVNRPPLSGAYTGVAAAVEVIVQQPQRTILASYFTRDTVAVRARSVAIPKPGGACLLALNKTADGAVTVQGTSQVALNGCDGHANSTSTTAMNVGGSANLTLGSASAVGQISGSSNITAERGVFSNARAIEDPYLSQNYPAFGGCSESYGGGNAILFPGVYCGGISLVGGANVTLNPGVYYLDGGDLKVAGNATLSGTGVTIVFTSSTGSKYSSASIGSNAIIDLTAPTSGPTAGIVLFGDRNMPAATSFKLTGGGTQSWGGAIYLPKAALTYAGGSNGGGGCTQIIADTVAFTGSSNLSLQCEGSGVSRLGTQIAAVVE